MTRVGAFLNGRRGVPVFVVLHYGISDDGQHQNGQQYVQFILQTQEGAVGERDYKTKRLPHTIVSKCCLFVPGEEDAIKSCRTESRRRVNITNTT